MPDEPGHTAVIALGANALAPSGAHSTITHQSRHPRERLAPVVDLTLDGRRLRVVHRAGPPGTVSVAPKVRGDPRATTSAAMRTTMSAARTRGGAAARSPLAALAAPRYPFGRPR